jgi:hypothetical protein
MSNSFFKRSARCGPTPFRYSTGFDNMFGADEIKIFETKIAEDLSQQL